jgi:hypothetical protein
MKKTTSQRTHSNSPINGEKGYNGNSIILSQPMRVNFSQYATANNCIDSGGNTAPHSLSIPAADDLEPIQSIRFLS